MTSSEEVSSSYPPPPPWYKKFTNTTLLQQKPPPIPQSTFTCFGVPCVPSQINNTSSNLPPLDSNTRLFDAFSSALKEEFQVLFKEFSHCSQHVLLMLSQMEPSKHQDLKSSVQHIIKLQKNLQHILSLLQEWEAKDELVSRLEAQVIKKRQILEALGKTLSPTL